MFGSKPSARYGLLIDIGSGSIGMAIVTSSNTDTYAQTLWQTREYIKVKNIESISDSIKALVATLTDMSMTVQTDGLPTLKQDHPSANITEVQVTVSAPWSYSITKNVTYEQSEPFTVTEDLITDLAVAAGEEAMQRFRDAYQGELPGVIETSRSVLDMYANGYRLPAINKQKTQNLLLSHNTTLVHAILYDALTELNEKVFGNAALEITSSMVGFYYATRQLKPHVYDVCLVDVTNEATEIGIVRDGSLTYCTHSAFGTVSIAREIAAATSHPLGEVAGRLSEVIETTDKKEVKTIMDAYKDVIVDLFKQTGDALTIPRTVYLLAPQTAQAAIMPAIKAAAEKANKTNTAIFTLEELMTTTDETTDSGLTIARRFFHTSKNRHHFVYL